MPDAREVGADDARDAERPVRFAVERDDGDRYRGARAADDLDRQLRVRDLRPERRKGQHDKGEPATKQQDHRAMVNGSERNCGTHAARVRSAHAMAGERDARHYNDGSGDGDVSAALNALRQWSGNRMLA